MDMVLDTVTDTLITTIITVDIMVVMDTDMATNGEIMAALKPLNSLTHLDLEPAVALVLVAD
jgi:hypothetical protein